LLHAGEPACDDIDLGVGEAFRQPRVEFGRAGFRALPRSPAEYARRFYYDTLLFDQRALRYLIDMVGAGQILVGTDYPYMPTELPVDKTLRTLNLPPDVHADITWNNCFRFLGVKPPSLSS